jgi:RNA polymerase sigma factor (TIGR02999 family)
LEVVYDELRLIAASAMRGERPDHTLQPTALAHEAYLRLVGDREIQARSRQQFFALAATAMRRILVNHARDRDRQKRGGDWRRMPFEIARETPGVAPDITELDILALDEAMTRLEALDERKARLVELRFYAGMTLEEAAAVLDVARSVASDDWRMARAWLADQLGDG